MVKHHHLKHVKLTWAQPALAENWFGWLSKDHNLLFKGPQPRQATGVGDFYGT